MATYIVLRHGSNKANQSMTQTAVIGSIEAKSREEARERFNDENPTVTVYANQHLGFVPQSKAKAWQIQEAGEADLYNRADDEYFASLGR